MSTLSLLHAVTVNDLAIEYNVYEDEVYADTDSADALIADYAFRVSEANFPSYFIMLAEYRMATILATALARDEQMASLFDAQTAVMAQQAKTLDSQQQHRDKLKRKLFNVINALVARPVGRQELACTKAARDAVEKEWQIKAQKIYTWCENTN